MQSSDENKNKPESGADSEATSKELLSDIEESEAEVDPTSSAPDPGPSPDGAVDESDEVKDAGPM